MFLLLSVHIWRIDIQIKRILLRRLRLWIFCPPFFLIPKIAFESLRWLLSPTIYCRTHFFSSVFRKTKKKNKLCNVFNTYWFDYFKYICTVELWSVSQQEKKYVSSIDLFSGAEPNWIGTYDISPLCDRQVCCCLTEQVEVKQVAHFFMTISGQLAGQCDGMSTFFLPAMKPSGFSTKLPIVGNVNLSEDSSTINVESPLGSQCNGRAIRH